MKKNKKVILIFTTLLLLTSIALFSYGSAFPGFHGNGPSEWCHSEPGSAAYDATFSATLDGQNNEAFWEYTTYVGSRMTIPVAGRFGSAHEYISIIFAQNSTHLYILVEWNDEVINGTDTPQYSPADGFGICFGINVTQFKAGYFSGMVTPEVGEAVDTLVWKPVAAADGTQLPVNDTALNQTVQGTLLDWHFDSDGWHADEVEAQAAAKHGNFSSNAQTNYMLEIVRPLASGNDGDAQFLNDGTYDFAIAVFNGSAGGGHWVSFEHAVFIYGTEGPVNNSTIPGFSIAIVSVISVVMVLVIVRRKKIRK